MSDRIQVWDMTMRLCISAGRSQIQLSCDRTVRHTQIASILNSQACILSDLANTNHQCKLNLVIKVSYNASIPCTLYSTHCILYTVYWILYTVQFLPALGQFYCSKEDIKDILGSILTPNRYCPGGKGKELQTQEQYCLYTEPGGRNHRQSFRVLIRPHWRIDASTSILVNILDSPCEDG